MAVTLGDPRYNLSVGLTDNNQNNYSRTLSYINTAVGGSSSGYTPEDIYDFAEAVASLSGGSLTTINLNAQYPINY